MKEYLEDIKGANVVITGGLGFVGHNLASQLADEYECEVTIIDDCSNSSPIVLQRIKKPVRFVQLSVTDSKMIFRYIQDADYLFHLACVQIAASGSDPLNDLKVNAESTLSLLEFIRRNPMPRLKRFIYTSSCSVYGNSANNFPAIEDGAVAPLSHYASTKLLGENYTLIYNSQYGIPTACVRYSNVFGYGQTPNNPYCGVMGKFIHNVLAKNPCTIIGDGEQTRDYTFVTDAVRATLLSAVHPKALGELFNVGTGKETSVNELVSILKELKNDIQVEYLPERDIDNIRRRVVSVEKIHSKLGWAPMVDIKRGIDLTFNWYKEKLESSEDK